MTANAATGSLPPLSPLTTISDEDDTPIQPLKPQHRRSIFLEVGLLDGDSANEKTGADTAEAAPPPRPSRKVRFRSKNSIIGRTTGAEADAEDDWTDASSDEEGKSGSNGMQLPSASWRFSRLSRVAYLALFLAIVLPLAQNTAFLRSSDNVLFGVKGGVVRPRMAEEAEVGGRRLVSREDTNTDVCKRWSHQSAIVNGTMYIYGGRSMTDSEQDSDTWNNDFLTVDLTTTWQIGSPTFKGLPRPSPGPPPVSNGYLWHSRDALFMYGGEFSDNPATAPVAFSLWEYDIAGSSWKEHKDPKTSAGNHAEGDGQPVQRSAEGAGFGVASLGRGWYFGGHLDDFTTQGWSNQIKRIYLKSMIEYTFPGASNSEVESLRDGKPAGEDGVWRNITEGGVQETSGFPERADGVLAHIPGFGEQGILLGLTGGTEEKFTQMNVIDVFDIATSKWYKQGTSGPTPKYRVNACAVVAAAPDGSSYNMYMYGGQNLVPFKEQIQYDDIWVLSIPSFTWVEIKTDGQSVPPARAGHTCSAWDGQMVVVGGYVGQELSCDSPGVYVFNMTSLEWTTAFNALSGPPGDSSSADANPFSQHRNQRGDDGNSGLEGSYGYAVPAAVYGAIGGDALGGATVTAPVASPTGGPFATGSPVPYAPPGEGSPSSPSSGEGRSSDRSRNAGIIAAATVAGVLALVAGYLAFCTWIYRRQLTLYKAHHAAYMARHHQEKQNSQNGGGAGAASAAAAMLLPPSSKASSDQARQHRRGESDSSSWNQGEGIGGGGARPNYFSSSSGTYGADGRRRSWSSNGSAEDLLRGQEPTFWGKGGVLLNPRRSLRVVNRD